MRLIVPGVLKRHISIMTHTISEGFIKGAARIKLHTKTPKTENNSPLLSSFTFRTSLQVFGSTVIPY